MSTETNNIEVCIHCENPTSYSICSSIECDKCGMSVETKLVGRKEELWDKVYPKLDEKMKGEVIITSTPKGKNNFYKQFMGGNSVETGKKP